MASCKCPHLPSLAVDLIYGGGSGCFGVTWFSRSLPCVQPGTHVIKLLFVFLLIFLSITEESQGELRKGEGELFFLPDDNIY